MAIYALRQLAQHKGVKMRILPVHEVKEGSFTQGAREEEGVPRDGDCEQKESPKISGAIAQC